MNRPEPFTIGEPVGRPIRSVRPLPLHRMAGAMADPQMVEAIEQRLRKGSPKSGAKHVRIDDDPLGDGSDYGVTGEWWGHVRLTDSRQIGENEFEELGSPFHWTTYVCVIVCTTVALYFGGQLVRGFLAGVLS